MTTTKFGIGAIVTGVVTLAYAITAKDPSQVGAAVLALLTGLGLIQAKDAA